MAGVLGGGLYEHPKKRAKVAKARSLFRELMAGVESMRDHREGRLTLRTHEVEPIMVPPVNPNVVRETREALNMSRQVFAFKIGVNPRTLERWEQGRANLMTRRLRSSGSSGSTRTPYSGWSHCRFPARRRRAGHFRD